MEIKIEERNIINFYDLEDEWQAEALSNLGDYAENCMFLEPEDGCNPTEHILWDLSDTMLNKGIHEDFEYNATMTISNNSGMLLQIDDSFETAKIIFI